MRGHELGRAATVAAVGLVLLLAGRGRGAAQSNRSDGVDVQPLSRTAGVLAAGAPADDADPLTAVLADRLRMYLARRAATAGLARRGAGQVEPPARSSADGPLEIHMRRSGGAPMQIRVPPHPRAARAVRRTPELTARAFLRERRRALRLDDPDTELELRGSEHDALGRDHLRYAQIFRGVPVWPAELIVHLDPDGDVDLVDGAFVATPRGLSTQPVVDTTAALAAARAAVVGGEYGSATMPTLIVYAPGDQLPRLGWKLEVSVSMTAHWLVVIDAADARVLTAFNEVADTAVTGSGVDLLGHQQTLHLWQDGATVYMVDTSKPMFDPSSPVPTLDTRGAIITLDAENGNPDDSNFQLVQVTSSNRNAWDPADAVSAAANIALTYDYYLERHNRNSIDGRGGSLLGVVRYEQNFDNAFWNGTLMVFGDAEPFAAALDVVGHELTHGVTQYTANLVYQDQPGAMNEAMSDIFGQAVEARAVGRADWLHGQILADPRNLKDPESVAICNGCPDYPAKMSEFIGPNDPFLDRFVNRDHNGVHINSTIISHAFYLLAEGLNDALGIVEAERIFYRALTTHLVGNSKFVDARLAAIASAEELFGAGSRQAFVTAEAFDAVEIFNGRGTPQPSPFPPVAGQDALLFVFYDNTAGAHFLARRESGFQDPFDGAQLTDNSVATARPSVEGNGSAAVFVSGDNDVCFVNTDGTKIDPNTDTVEDCLGFPNFINSVAVAPGGQRFGFVLLDSSGEPDNKIRVIDLGPSRTRTFTLQAPTLDAHTTDTILNADVMDFTADGRFLIYDALNELRVAGGDPVQAWSIFALDLDTDTTQTIVPPRSGMDISNPALSQASDNFVTFDAFDEATENSTVFAVNLTTGQRAVVATVVNGLGVPGYTGDDSAVVYSQSDSSSTGFSLMRQPLAADHITPNGPPSQVIANADFGVIYRRGTFVGPQPTVCAGDCSSDGVVTVDELVLMVNTALAIPGAACVGGDANGDGRITIDEIVAAVHNAVGGCAAG